MTTGADAGALFKAGRLDEAVAAATEAVRKAPTDLGPRLLLAELLLFQGRLERVRAQGGEGFGKTLLDVGLFAEEFAGTAVEGVRRDEPKAHASAPLSRLRIKASTLSCRVTRPALASSREAFMRASPASSRASSNSR